MIFTFLLVLLEYLTVAYCGSSAYTPAVVETTAGTLTLVIDASFT